MIEIQYATHNFRNIMLLFFEIRKYNLYPIQKFSHLYLAERTLALWFLDFHTTVILMREMFIHFKNGNCLENE